MIHGCIMSHGVNFVDINIHTFGLLPLGAMATVLAMDTLHTSLAVSVWNTQSICPHLPDVHHCTGLRI